MEDKTVPPGMLSKFYDNGVYIDLGKLIELNEIEEELRREYKPPFVLYLGKVFIPFYGDLKTRRRAKLLVKEAKLCQELYPERRSAYRKEELSYRVMEAMFYLTKYISYGCLFYQLYKIIS